MQSAYNRAISSTFNGHMEPVGYITPEKFEKYRIRALENGFDFVESGPLVRSSFHAERHVTH